MSCARHLLQFAIRRQAIESTFNFRNLSSFVAMLKPDEQHRVLSIQSHVVHGYCGNKSAVFPLQVILAKVFSKLP